MSQKSVTPMELRLRRLERWAMVFVVAVSLVPLLPYAVNGAAI